MLLSVLSGVLWVGLALLGYTYIGYPILLLLLGLLIGDEPDGSEIYTPSVTMVVPVHNEAEVIPEKVDNTQNITYPGEFRCLFISDSTDGTDQLLRSAMTDMMELITLPQRRGKSYAINCALQTIETEVIVLSDANTMYEPDAINELVGPLYNDRIGCVTGQLRLSERGSDSGESVYWAYELWLRRLEARLGTTVSVNGGLLAFRSQDVEPLPEHALTDDFVLAMRQIRAGRRVHFEPSAIGYENDAGGIMEEFRRRVRIGAGNYQALVWFADFLIPWRVGGKVTLEFLSHRVLRWIAPWMLVVVLVASVGLVLLTDSLVSWMLLAGQTLAYLLGIAGLFNERLREFILIRLLSYFVAMNGALALGLLTLLHKNTVEVWRASNTRR